MNRRQRVDQIAQKVVVDGGNAAGAAIPAQKLVSRAAGLLENVRPGQLDVMLEPVFAVRLVVFQTRVLAQQHPQRRHQSMRVVELLLHSRLVALQQNGALGVSHAEQRLQVQRHRGAFENGAAQVQARRRRLRQALFDRQQVGVSGFDYLLIERRAVPIRRRQTPVGVDGCAVAPALPHLVHCDFREGGTNRPRALAPLAPGIDGGRGHQGEHQRKKVSDHGEVSSFSIGGTLDKRRGTAIIEQTAPRAENQRAHVPLQPADRAG